MDYEYEGPGPGFFLHVRKGNSIHGSKRVV